MPIAIQFDEEELSRDYTEVATGGPTFDTGVIGTPFGVQQRVIRRQDSIRTWDIEYGGLSDAQKQSLEDFFITKYGAGIGFRFFPPSDNKFRSDLVGVTNAGNSYQLIRSYVKPSRTITRKIVKPVIQLWPNGTNVGDGASPVVLAQSTTVLAQVPWEPIYGTPGFPGYVFPPIPPGYFQDPSPTVAVTINPLTGFWKFMTTSPWVLPANGFEIRAVAGQYDVPVVFDVDKMEFTEYGVFTDLQSIRLTEILPVALGL